MTAPIFSRPEIYKLNMEIKRGADGFYYLKEEKEYRYDNVWKAKNSYEKFFETSYGDPYDVVESEPECPFYDRWINMIGNEKSMVVKTVYIFQFKSFEDALEKEVASKKEFEEIEKEYKIFCRDYDIENEVLPFEDTHKDDKDITSVPFKELGMSESSCRVFAKIGVNSFKALKLFYEEKEYSYLGGIGRRQLERSLNELEEIAQRNNFYEELNKMRKDK